MDGSQGKGVRTLAWRASGSAGSPRARVHADPQGNICMRRLATNLEEAEKQRIDTLAGEEAAVAMWRVITFCSRATCQKSYRHKCLDHRK